MSSLEHYLWDNPILIKHLRSRLRRGHLIPALMLTVAVGIGIIWVGQVLNWHIRGWTVAGVMVVQIIALVFVGANQVGAAVGGARASGILEYHRISPMAPTAIALGFLIGAPIREYLIYLATIPFLIACCYLAQVGAWAGVQLVVTLLLITWNLHALALTLSLVTTKAKGAQQNATGGLILLGLILGGPMIGGLSFVLNLFTDPAPRITVFGFSWHWLACFVLYASVLLGFLLAGNFRKMRSDRTHLYSKPTATAFLATLALMLVGICWGHENWEVSIVLLVMYPLLVLAVGMIGTITPDRAGYLKGLRQAFKEGRRRPPIFSDSATNRLTLVAYGAILAAAGSVAWELIVGRIDQVGEQYTLSIVVAVFTMAYVGLALQFFLLRMKKEGSSTLIGLLVLLWAGPIVGGMIAAALNPQPGGLATLPLAILSLSPPAGMAITVGFGPQEVQDIVRLAALLPPLALTFLFNYLLVVTQRRIDMAVRRGTTPGNIHIQHELDGKSLDLFTPKHTDLSAKNVD